MIHCYIYQLKRVKKVFPSFDIDLFLSYDDKYIKNNAHDLITARNLLAYKKIKNEIHHLSFNDLDYKEKGAFIKWNPAVKSELDQDALWEALNSDRIDIVATDHAPHTLEEKQNIVIQVTC